MVDMLREKCHSPSRLWQSHPFAVEAGTSMGEDHPWLRFTQRRGCPGSCDGSHLGIQAACCSRHGGICMAGAVNLPSSTAAATGGPIRLLQSLAISIWALPHRAHLRQPHCAKGGKPVDLAARWSPSREDLQGEWERLRLHGIPVQNCKNCTFSQNIQSNESACSCSCTVRVCILILSAQAHPGRKAKIPHTNSLARSAASMCRLLARAHLGNGWPAPNIAL
jgi:hypothetical protein